MQNSISVSLEKGTSGRDFGTPNHLIVRIRDVREYGEYNCERTRISRDLDGTEEETRLDARVISRCLRYLEKRRDRRARRRADPDACVCVAEQPRPGDMREKPAGHPGVPSVTGRVSTTGSLHRAAVAAVAAATRAAATRAAAAAALLRDEPEQRRHRTSPSTGVAGHRRDTSLPARGLHPHRRDDARGDRRGHPVVRAGRLHDARLLRRRLHRQ